MLAHHTDPQSYIIYLKPVNHVIRGAAGTGDELAGWSRNFYNTEIVSCCPLDRLQGFHDCLNLIYLKVCLMALFGFNIFLPDGITCFIIKLIMLKYQFHD